MEPHRQKLRAIAMAVTAGASERRRRRLYMTATVWKHADGFLLLRPSGSRRLSTTEATV